MPDTGLFVAAAAECALGIVKHYSMSAAVCPFCRTLVQGFAPTHVDLKWGGGYLAVKQHKEKPNQQQQEKQQPELGKAGALQSEEAEPPLVKSCAELVVTAL